MNEERGDYESEHGSPCEEKVAALENQIKQYEELLEETLAEEKKIKIIDAGPFEFEGKSYYRVDGEMKFYNVDSVFGLTQPLELEKGTSVVVSKASIVSILPKELEVEEDLPAFKHIAWSSIGGLDTQINEIKQAVELPMKNQKLAKELGVGDFKGLLLFGAAGCGKTVIAKAIASEIIAAGTKDPRAFQYVKGAEILSKFVGEAEARIANMFKRAREYSKATGTRSVIFMDEAEALLAPRGSRVSSDVDKTIVPTFLSEMDGFDEHSPIMILSTNLPKQIDKAILREGRIDLKIEIKRPEQVDAVEIFKIHLKTAKLVDKIDELANFGADLIFKTVACKARVSGAMIEGVVKGSARKALNRLVSNPKDKNKGVIFADLEESFKLINSSYAS